MSNRSLWLTALFCLSTACGNENPLEIGTDPSDKNTTSKGLNVQLIDDIASPPANIAAVVRVTGQDGRPLGQRLGAQAFELWEDGALLSNYEAQRMVAPIDRATVELTIVVLDLSGSVTRSGLTDSMVDGAKKLALSLASETHRVAIFGFDGRPDLVPYAYFTSSEESLDAALEKVRIAPIIDDSTNLYGAVINALGVLDEAVQVEAETRDQIAHGNLVIFTDGRDRASRASKLDAQTAIEASEHSTFAIAVGQELDKQSLSEIGQSASFIATDHEEISRAFDEVAREVKALAQRDYLVSYCTPARAGAHSLTLKVSSGDLEGTVSLDFLADGFGAGCAPENVPLYSSAK